MKKFLNEAGMSMVNVMMAAAMMGGLALVVAQLGKNSNQVVKSTKTSTEINAFYNNMEQIFLKSHSCIATFNYPSSLAFPVNVKVPVPSIYTDYPELNPDGSIISHHYNEKFIAASPPTVTKNYIGPSRVYISEIYASRVDNNTLTLVFKLNRGTHSKPNIVEKKIELAVQFNPDNTVKNCFSQLDGAVQTAVINAREEACKDIDPNATWTPATGCVLSDAYKKQIFEDGLSQMNSTPVYTTQAGLLSTTAPVVKVRCTLNHKRCSRTNAQDCTPSCPSGYFNAGRASGRYDVQQSAFDKKCCRDYNCKKSNSTGTLLLN